MTIQEFCVAGKNAVTGCLRASGFDNVIVEETDAVKANDTRYYGLNLRERGSIIGRAIYIDDLYDRYLEGEDLKELLDEVCKRCVQCMYIEPPEHVSGYCDALKDYRERLSLRLLSKEANIEYLEDKPYIDAGNGLALVATINCDKSITSEWRMPVTNDLLDTLECDAETLLTDAMKNTMDMEPAALMSLKALVDSRMNNEIDQEPENYLSCQTGNLDTDEVYVLSNESMYQGAAALFYPGIMQKTSSVLGCGYFVIPSSVHEIMIIPDDMGASEYGLKMMLESGNRDVIDDDDILSYDVYHYDPESQELSIAC